MIENLEQSQIILIITIMAASAVPVGFMAGLFGIGGGLITVPVLFYIFNSIGLDQSFIMHLAVGTSFAIIIPTSISSVFTHMKYKAVDFNVVKTFGVFVVLGVILGTIFAAKLKTSGLILFFSIMTMIFSLFFLVSKEKPNPIKKEINLFIKILSGFTSGFLSAPMGIGGGIINTPILKMFGYPINVAIGCSAAFGFLISLIGAIGFIISGKFLNISAPLSVGFVNIPAFLIFVPITTFMAKVGAKTVHKVNKQIIGKLFGIFLLLISLRLFLEYNSF
tara:strand:+ start:297 stop:1130 length:834 start_codon:yes stop_codon:yes gene_type:complete